MDKRSYLHRFLTQVKKVIYSPSFRYLIIGLIMTYLAFNLVGGKKDAIIATAIYFIVGMGFTLLLGYAGLASLGTAGFMALGAYMFGFLNDRGQGLLGIPAPIAALIVLLTSVILGLFIGVISLRIEGIFLAIVTLGLSEIVVELMKNLAITFTGVQRFKLMTSALWFGQDQNLGIYSDYTKYFILISMVIIMILVSNVMKSATGRAMLSLKNSQSAGQAMGMGLLKYRLTAFVISTILASFAGVLYMAYYHYTEPFDWNLSKSLLILAAVIIGGAKSIVGVLFGTVAVFTINTLFLQQIPFFRDNSGFITIFSGLLIIVIVMFFPGGLYHLALILKYRAIKLHNQLKTKFKNFKLNRKEQLYGKDEEYRPFEPVI